MFALKAAQSNLSADVIDTVTVATRRLPRVLKHSARRAAVASSSKGKIDDIVWGPLR